MEVFLKVILPVFLVIGTGYLSVWYKWLNAENIDSLTSFAQNFAIPCLLFYAIAKIEIGEYFDSISICLSKGLGAPVGSVLLGSKQLIDKARRIRKVMGGGMRQAGLIASAGLFARQNNVERLVEDHVLAKSIETLLNDTDFVANVLPVETNIIVFELNAGIDVPNFLNHLKEAEILAFQVGPKQVRLVTHLDIPKTAITGIEDALSSYSSSL